MNSLSIVLTAVLGVLAAIIICGVAAISIKNKILKQKIGDQEVLDEYAPPSPIVFLGDSLTDFYPAFEFLRDPRIVNRGIAGDTAADVAARLSSIITLKPKAVFLQVGINDVIRGFDKRRAGAIADGITAVSERLRRVTEVKIISLYPVNRRKSSVSRFMLRKADNRAIALLNALLKKYADKRGIEFIDVYSALLSEDGCLREEYTVEGLHLTYAGYEAVTAVLRPYLKNIE